MTVKIPIGRAAGLTLLTLLALFLCNLSPSYSAPTKFDEETQVELKDKSKFKISSGWSWDESAQKIKSPENDLNLYLVERPATSDLEEMSRIAWKSVVPNFDFKVLQKATPPAQDGWELLSQITYDVPAKENRTVFTIVRTYKGRAYIMLLDSANGALDKRASQFQIIVDTWRPEGMQREDLSQHKAKKFGKEDEADFDRFIADAMEKLNVPGAAVAIVQKDKVVYRKGFGVKTLGNADKVSPETMFMIGSTTKPLTTLMLAKLVEMDKLKWSTPVKTVLPEFELADKTITPKVLMKHTACACTGMPRRDMEEVFGSKINSIEDTLRQLHTMKPTSGFGETFQYSNQLVAVGGLAGANAYDKGIDLFNKYENAMSDLVFQPLRMTSTRVRPREPDLERLASPHARGYDGKLVPFSQKIDDAIYTIAPAGSIWSTVGDMSNYVLMELHNGKNADGQQIFSEEQIMRRRKPGVKVDEDTKYGLGLFIENDNGAEIIHHGGNTLGFTSDMIFLPKNEIGMVVLTNAGGVNGFRNALKQKLLEVFLAAHPRATDLVRFSAKHYKDTNTKQQERVSLKAADLSWIRDYVGKYENKDLGPAQVVEEHDGHFKFTTPRWSSEIGSAKDANGDKLIALTSAPWWLGELRVQKTPTRKLILDDAQVKYEFNDLSPPLHPN